jgi:hypothetical protein
MVVSFVTAIFREDAFQGMEFHYRPNKGLCQLASLSGSASRTRPRSRFRVRRLATCDIRPAAFGVFAGRLIRRLRARTPALVSRLKPKSRWKPNRSFRGNPLDELPQNGIHCLRQFRRHGPKQLGYSFFKKGERKT